MLPVINRNVHDTRAQLQTGHQDIRSYFSQATVIPAHPNVPLLDIRQRFQSARTRMATPSYDIRQYFPASLTAPLKTIGYQPRIMYST
jgi:hypothetical protein